MDTLKRERYANKSIKTLQMPKHKSSFIKQLAGNFRSINIRLNQITAESEYNMIQNFYLI